MFLGKGLLKLRSKIYRRTPRVLSNIYHRTFFKKMLTSWSCQLFTGEHPCQSVISIKLLCNFTEIILRHGCSPVNLLHIFRKSFPTYGGLLLASTFLIDITSIFDGCFYSKVNYKLFEFTHWGFKWILTEEFKFWIKSTVILTWEVVKILR